MQAVTTHQLDDCGPASSTEHVCVEEGTRPTSEMQREGPRKVGPYVVKSLFCHSADNGRGSAMGPPVEVIKVQITAMQVEAAAHHP